MTAESTSGNSARVEHRPDGLTLTLPAPSEPGMVFSGGFGILFLLATLLGTAAIFTVSAGYMFSVGNVLGLLQDPPG